METVEIFKGEKRVITVEVSSCNSEPFSIRNPTYKLKYGSIVEDEGIPIQQDHQLTVVVEPLKAGTYHLELLMDIAEEKIIRKIQIVVKP